MIKLLRLSVITLLYTYSFNASAQIVSQADSIQKDSIYKVLFNRRGKSIFFEAGGPGVVYSFNYDVRFNKRQNGLGMRIGLNYYVFSKKRLAAVPVMVNHLTGKKGHYLEIGAGITYYRAYEDYPIFFHSDNSESNPYPVGYDAKFHWANGVIGNFNIGYRYQPLKGGLTLRIGGGPLATTKKQYPFWPYASVGYSFKHKSKKAK